MTHIINWNKWAMKMYCMHVPSNAVIAIVAKTSLPPVALPSSDFEAP